MDPADREQRLEELVTWVDWLVETFDLRSQVARCWYRHPRLIEHFSALFIGWVRTYAGDPTKLSTRAELDWIKELYALLPRLNSASCQTKHIDPPPQSYSMAEAFDQWLGEADRPFLDSPRSHPAKEQVGRMAKAKRVEDAAKAKAKEAGDRQERLTRPAQRQRAGPDHPGPALCLVPGPIAWARYGSADPPDRAAVPTAAPAAEGLPPAVPGSGGPRLPPAVRTAGHRGG